MPNEETIFRTKGATHGAVGTNGGTTTAASTKPNTSKNKKKKKNRKQHPRNHHQQQQQSQSQPYVSKAERAAQSLNRNDVIMSMEENDTTSKTATDDDCSSTEIMSSMELSQSGGVSQSDIGGVCVGDNINGGVGGQFIPTPAAGTEHTDNGTFVLAASDQQQQSQGEEDPAKLTYTSSGEIPALIDEDSVPPPKQRKTMTTTSITKKNHKSKKKKGTSTTSSTSRSSNSVTTATVADEKTAKNGVVEATTAVSSNTDMTSYEKRRASSSSSAAAVPVTPPDADLTMEAGKQTRSQRESGQIDSNNPDRRLQETGRESDDDDAPSTPPSSSNIPGSSGSRVLSAAVDQEEEDTTPYLPELDPSPSDRMSTSTRGGSMGGGDASSVESFPRLSVRTSYHIRPRRGRIVSLDRGRSDQTAYATFLQEDLGYQSNDSASIHTDGGLGRRHSSHSHYHHHHNRGSSGISSARHNSNSSSSHHHQRTNDFDRHAGRYSDDESSSDDDSSYFATNLPSPRSGRSFSLSSTASAPARTSMFQLTKQESDASLSFSDESEDDEYHNANINNSNDRSSDSYQRRSEGSLSHPDSQEARGQVSQKNRREDVAQNQNVQTSSSSSKNDGVHLAQMKNPNSAVADMNLYPRRITRMHSVSSLVSSASDDDREDGSQYTTDDGDDYDDDDDSQSIAGGSRSSAGASSTMSSLAPSTNDVLVSDAVMEAAAAAGTAMAIAGGQHPSSVDKSTRMIRPQDFSSANGGYSMFDSIGHGMTPGLSPAVNQPGILAFSGNQPWPSQQTMTNEQMHAWIAAASATRPSHSSSPLGLASPQPAFGQNEPFKGNSSRFHPSFQVPSMADDHPSMVGVRTTSDHTFASSASGSIPFTYSDDEDLANGGFYSMVASTSSQSIPAGRQVSNFGTGGGAGGGGKAFGLGQRTEPDLRPDSAGHVENGTDEAADDVAIAAGATAVSDIEKSDDPSGSGRQTFKVYWQRWIMLMYMSILNLLSDWTCYSVAPISLLTEEAFGNIDPERLVVVFLGANAIATACEPIILARLGLRRTVLLGSLLLMIGSIVKSGGLPPIITPNLEKGHAEVSLYLGFFLVGLSQPLYQCTPALLSASWFPEKERTMATGVALNANQLGIGFAFIFGTLLVAEADDIPGYFGLLSQISTIVFIGTLIQFDDAPPTPPSSSARAMRGDFRMPRVGSIVGRMTSSIRPQSNTKATPKAEAPSPAPTFPIGQKSMKGRSRRSSNRSSNGRRSNTARRRSNAPARSYNALAESGLTAPSSAHYGSTLEAMENAARVRAELSRHNAEAPSPAPMSGMPQNIDNNLGAPSGQQDGEDSRPDQTPFGQTQGVAGIPPPMPGGPYGYAYPPPPYQYPMYWGDPRFQRQQQEAMPPPYYPSPYYQQPPIGQPGVPPTDVPAQPPLPFYPPGQPMPPPPYMHQQFPVQLQDFDPYYMYGNDPYEDGAEPIVTITDHHLDINIRDDQVIRSLHACMTRKGFSHALAAFTVSGIVINTLSTFMDYLVRLNGAPRTYTGIVGGTFQFVIMISSLIIGKQTDKTRAYYSVTIAMLVLGAFGLAECGVSLDSDRGGDLRWSLVVVAALVGPLQPVSTEFGVEVAYPLSENTVLVIQQLFSNLLSAIFIPFFKALKDIGSTRIVDGEVVQHPDYTFSFYLLIVLHTGVTVYFATFNGSYLRYEHELEKKAMEDREEEERAGNGSASANPPVHPFFAGSTPAPPAANISMGEHQPLLQSNVV